MLWEGIIEWKLINCVREISNKTMHSRFIIDKYASMTQHLRSRSSAVQKLQCIC